MALPIDKLTFPNLGKANPLGLIFVFITKDKIVEKFNSIGFDHNKNVIFSCGSGVTASVLALAYSLINAKYMPTIYDGSWSEYGKS